MQTSNRDPKVQLSWFLGTGPLEYYYTLWCKTLVPGVGCYYSYRQNLSHEYDEAVAKATAKTGQQSWEQFDISEYKRTNAASPDLSKDPDEVILSFGKYAGQSVGQLIDENIGYLWFLAAKSDWEPTQAKHARVLNYIRAMFRQQAQEVEKARQDKYAAERAARDAARLDLPAFEGRVIIEGIVRSTKVVESQFGSILKMLVEHDTGWKVFGTVPSQLGGVEKGDRIRFHAIVEKSQTDPKFGYFSRPTRASLVKAEAIACV